MVPGRPYQDLEDGDAPQPGDDVADRIVDVLVLGQFHRIDLVATLNADRANDLARTRLPKWSRRRSTTGE